MTCINPSLLIALHFEFMKFHPPKVVFRYHDPQLQVDENYSYLSNIQPILAHIIIEFAWRISLSFNRTTMSAYDV